ncbi:MAG TPA: hypothetical protein VN688_10520 [Gemmataceae bacterium]|nr:hypothetical protein [Gemmataceae bacterium]
MMARIELGPAGREAVPVLLIQLKDRHAAIRWAAEEVLRQLDPEVAAKVAVH